MNGPTIVGVPVIRQTTDSAVFVMTPKISLTSTSTVTFSPFFKVNKSLRAALAFQPESVVLTAWTLITQFKHRQPAARQPGNS